MRWKGWVVGAGLAFAAGLVLVAPTEAADPELPTCSADEVLVWAPHGRVDPIRKRACQA